MECQGSSILVYTLVTVRKYGSLKPPVGSPIKFPYRRTDPDLVRLLFRDYIPCNRSLKRTFWSFKNGDTISTDGLYYCMQPCWFYNFSSIFPFFYLRTKQKRIIRFWQGLVGVSERVEREREQPYIHRSSLPPTEKSTEKKTNLVKIQNCPPETNSFSHLSRIELSSLERNESRIGSPEAERETIVIGTFF